MNELEKWLNGFNTKSFIRRIIFMLPVLALSAFGIACYYACSLGADPISCFIDGQHTLFKLTYGQITTINNAVLFVLMIIWGRKYLGVGTLMGVFLSGPMIDFFEAQIRTEILVGTPALWLRLLILAVGVFTFAVGTALYIMDNIGIGAFDFLALVICDRTDWKLRWTRIVLDLIFVIVGWLMGGIVGIGTLAGAFLTGPIMSATMKVLNSPLEKLLSTPKKTAPTV